MLVYQIQDSPEDHRHKTEESVMASKVEVVARELIGKTAYYQNRFDTEKFHLMPAPSVRFFIRQMLIATNQPRIELHLVLSIFWKQTC